MYSEVCLIMNVFVTLYSAFSTFLWLINVRLSEQQQQQHKV